MTLRELLKPIDNGSKRLQIYSETTGEFFIGIWQNHIDETMLNAQVKSVEKYDGEYELRIVVE